MKQYSAEIPDILNARVEEFLRKYRIVYNRKMTRTELMIKAIEVFMDQTEYFLRDAK